MPMYRHILFATDLSPMTEAIAQRAAGLACEFRAQLTLLHVVEHFLVDAPNDPIPPEDADPATFLEAAAHNRLGGLARRIGQRRARLKVIMSTGPATHAIVDAAREIGADLIVLASSGHEHAPHLLRSTPCAVLNDAPCDVLALLADGTGAAIVNTVPKRLSRRARVRQR